MSGIHRRQPRPAAAGAGQAQRGADHRRQPQGTAPEVDQAAQHVRDVAGGVGVIGPVLQGLPRQPAARPVRAAVRRRCVLRSRPGSQRLVAFASAPTRRPASPAPQRCRCRIPRTGQGGEPNLTLARRDHRQARAIAAVTPTASRCPLRRPAARRPARRRRAARLTSTPTDAARYVPAPDEVPAPSLADRSRGNDARARPGGGLVVALIAGDSSRARRRTDLGTPVVATSTTATASSSATKC